MKFFENRFEDYLTENNKCNMHPEIDSLFSSLPNKIKGHPNLIFYGPSGVGKYTQVLRYIKKFSQSNLKYERKTNTPSIRKKNENYTFKISDIHYEIDMQTLGCNARLLWNNIYKNIIDIISSTQKLEGIIVCKNYHTIHKELLDIFHTYMQTLNHTKINIFYILISEHVSFIPYNIMCRSIIVPLKRPTKNLYQKCIGKKFNLRVNEITNIKYLKNKKLIDLNYDSLFVKNIADIIISPDDINFMELRENIYNILILNIDMFDIIYKLLVLLCEKNKINEKTINKVLTHLHKFLFKYNNNYRPIYHIESLLLFICKKIHDN